MSSVRRAGRADAGTGAPRDLPARWPARTSREPCGRRTPGASSNQAPVGLNKTPRGGATPPRGPQPRRTVRPSAASGRKGTRPSERPLEPRGLDFQGLLLLGPQAQAIPPSPSRVARGPDPSRPPPHSNPLAAPPWALFYQTPVKGVNPQNFASIHSANHHLHGVCFQQNYRGMLSFLKSISFDLNSGHSHASTRPTTVTLADPDLPRFPPSLFSSSKPLPQGWPHTGVSARSERMEARWDAGQGSGERRRKRNNLEACRPREDRAASPAQRLLGSTRSEPLSWTALPLPGACLGTCPGVAPLQGRVTGCFLGSLYTWVSFHQTK